MASLNLDSSNLMKGYRIVVKFRHTKMMRLRFYLAGWLMVIVAKLMNVGEFRFEPLEVEPNCDCNKCGNACSYVEPYGFVPECGCPVHDPGEHQEEKSGNGGIKHA